MDRRDILTMLVGVALVAVLAVAVPILTGRDSGNPQDTGTGGIVWDTGGGTPPATPVILPETPSPTPTPWDMKPITIGFVTGTLSPSPTLDPATLPNRTMVTYATINGRWSGTTQTFAIPFPYWQLEYTADPTALPPDVFPRIIIQVFDAGDPNRVVRVIDQQVYTEAPENPWVENFYEGNRSYYFQITTRFIKSYTINLKVPMAYV